MAQLLEFRQVTPSFYSSINNNVQINTKTRTYRMIKLAWFRCSRSCHYYYGNHTSIYVQVDNVT